MKLLLAENGQPLLHTLRLGQEDRAVLDEAVRIAEEQHGLSPDAPPLAGSQSASFTFSAQNVAWRAELRLDGSAGGRWTSLLAVQSLAPEAARAGSWRGCSFWRESPVGRAWGWCAGSWRAGRCAGGPRHGRAAEIFERRRPRTSHPAGGDPCQRGGRRR